MAEQDRSRCRPLTCFCLLIRWAARALWPRCTWRCAFESGWVDAGGRIRGRASCDWGRVRIAAAACTEGRGESIQLGRPIAAASPPPLRLTDGLQVLEDRVAGAVKWGRKERREPELAALVAPERRAWGKPWVTTLTTQ